MMQEELLDWTETLIENLDHILHWPKVRRCRPFSVNLGQNSSNNSKNKQIFSKFLYDVARKLLLHGNKKEKSADTKGCQFQ